MDEKRRNSLISYLIMQPLTSLWEATAPEKLKVRISSGGVWTLGTGRRLSASSPLGACRLTAIAAGVRANTCDFLVSFLTMQPLTSLWEATAPEKRKVRIQPWLSGHPELLGRVSLGTDLLQVQCASPFLS